MRELGQHFLVDASIASKILKAAETKPSETVIEVGPGKAALTRGLAARAKAVIAIEIDPALARALRKEFAGTNVKIVEADALRLLPKLRCDLLISNTPYAIAEALIRLLPRARFSRALLALPNPLVRTLHTPTALGIFFQSFFASEVVAAFPKQATQPPAPHNGSVLRILPRPAAGSTEAALRELLLSNRQLPAALREALIATGARANKREGRALAARMLMGIPPRRAPRALTGPELQKIRAALEKALAG